LHSLYLTLRPSFTTTLLPLESSPTSITVSRDISFRNDLITAFGKTIPALEVTEMKFGYAPIRLDMYTIGTRYTIALKTASDSLVVNFRSYFGISRNSQYAKYGTLLNAIWDSTLVRLLQETHETVTSGQPVDFGNCMLKDDGIELKGFLITWEDLLYQKNYNRLTLNSKSNDKVWTNLYHLETYNTQVLMYYLDWRLGNVTEGGES
jgi:hypothetical protein